MGHWRHLKNRRPNTTAIRIARNIARQQRSQRNLTISNRTAAAGDATKNKQEVILVRSTNTVTGGPREWVDKMLQAYLLKDKILADKLKVIRRSYFSIFEISD